MRHIKSTLALGVTEGWTFLLIFIIFWGRRGVSEFGKPVIDTNPVFMRIRRRVRPPYDTGVQISIYLGVEGQEPPKLLNFFVSFLVKFCTPVTPNRICMGIRFARKLLLLTYPSVLHSLFRGCPLRVWVHVPTNMTTVAGQFLRNFQMRRKSLGVDRENSSLEGVYTPRVCIWRPPLPTPSSPLKFFEGGRILKSTIFAHKTGSTNAAL